MDDLSGGTFTISNLGVFGIDDFDPIINPPEVAILGVGRIRDDDSMTLSLSFDHRVVNGADAARFLDTLVGTLTDASALADFYEADVDAAAVDVEDAGAAAASATGSDADAPTEPRDVRVENPEGYAGRYRTAFGDVAFDEPEDHGGSGTAPSPVDHLLGALGSCLSLSVRAMASRDDVPVGEVSCDVRGSPDGGPLKRVAVELELETDADEDAVETVVTKAERACHVNRALSEDLPVSLKWSRA
jgi:pyruvate dehydrogenase E2 component (dihydrolipoamide acetyltransferase)